MRKGSPSTMVTIRRMLPQEEVTVCPRTKISSFVLQDMNTRLPQRPQENPIGPVCVVKVESFLPL